MKVWKTIAKIIVALAAVAGAIYIAATYGDRIVAWAKKMLGYCPCCCDADCEECPCEDDCDDCSCDCCCDEGCCCSCGCDEVAEAAEEVEVKAEDTDFEG